jgi:hypothetical protein
MGDQYLFDFSFLGPFEASSTCIRSRDGKLSGGNQVVWDGVLLKGKREAQ